MSLKFIPPSSHASSTTSSSPSSQGAPSAASVPDTLRHGRTTHPNTHTSSPHPLEQRLRKWDETQHALKMESLRRLYGAAEPIRRGMELKIAAAGYWPSQLGGPANVHYDILMNRDCTLEWEDVYKGTEDVFELPDFHTEMERKCGMNW